MPPKLLCEISNKFNHKHSYDYKLGKLLTHVIPETSYAARAPACHHTDQI